MRRKPHACRTAEPAASCRPADVIRIPVGQGDRPEAAGDDGEDIDSADASVCPGISRPLSQELGRADDGSAYLNSTSEGDVRIYVTVRPNPAGAPGATTVCHRDAFGRPVIVHINVDAPLLARLHAFAPAAAPPPAGLRDVAATLRAVLRHELMHALALTWTTLAQFRNRSRRLRSNVLVERQQNEALLSYLVTPHAVFAVRQHFRVPNDTAELQLDSVVPGLEVLGVQADPPEAGQVRAPATAAPAACSSDEGVRARPRTVHRRLARARRPSRRR